MKNLEVTIINHLLAFKWLLAYMLGSILILAYFGIDLNNITLSILLIWMLPQITITLSIHFNYYILNRKSKYVINKSEIVDLKSNIVYKSTEIDKIIIHKDVFDSYKYAPFQYYKYCTIKLKNGDSFILTSLLHSNIDKYLINNLKGVCFEVDKSFTGYW